MELRYQEEAAEAAYAELDRVAEKLARDGNKSDALELYVVDEERRAVKRPGAQ